MSKAKSSTIPLITRGVDRDEHKDFAKLCIDMDTNVTAAIRAYISMASRGKAEIYKA